MPAGRLVPVLKKTWKFVEKLILEDARITNKILAKINTFWVSVRTFYTILHDHLNLSLVSARWEPRILTSGQKQVRVECFRESLELYGENLPSIFGLILKVFWDWKGILLIEKTEKSHSITVASYTLRNLKEVIKKKGTGKLSAGVFLLHDNALVRKGRIAKTAL